MATFATQHALWTVSSGSWMSPFFFSSLGGLGSSHFSQRFFQALAHLFFVSKHFFSETNFQAPFSLQKGRLKSLYLSPNCTRPLLVGCVIPCPPHSGPDKPCYTVKQPFKDVRVHVFNVSSIRGGSVPLHSIIVVFDANGIYHLFTTFSSFSFVRCVVIYVQERAYWFIF